MATILASQAVDFRQLDVADLLGAPIKASSPTLVSYGDADLTITLHGSFTYRGGALSGGTVSAYEETFRGAPVIRIDGVAVPVSSLLQWAGAGDNASAREAFLGAADSIQGSAAPDWLIGYGGYDSIFGGEGNDTVEGGVRESYLRGELGNDRLYGGPGFDDINGNEGADIISGMEGDDWVVGGKDGDQIWGGAGNDIVYGNMGNDFRLLGEAGDDTVRGGQGDDTIDGGDGADWLSGDRGADRIAGGAGADIFHGFAGCGLDSVVDFRPEEGDRIVLDAGTNYRVDFTYPNTSYTILYLSEGVEDRMVISGISPGQFNEAWISFV